VILVGEVKIILPGGQTVTGEKGRKIIEIIPHGIGLVAKYNGKLTDLSARIEEDGVIEILNFDHPEAKKVFWHTAAHILAQAVKELFPNYQLGIGHPIENGFFYEFYTYDTPFTPDDLIKIEDKMREIVARDIPIIREEISREEAIELFKQRNERFKVELLEDMKEKRVSIYRQGDFIDLCRGPHLPSTGYVKHFKLLNISSAYWKGIEGNPSMQRVYGIAFPEKSMLKEYLKMLEEAKKRDHRVLGPRLELFEMFEETAGPGLVYWLPKGAIVRRIIEDFLIKIHLKNGYQLVYTPHIARTKLYEISGHIKYYRENMFMFDIENDHYAIKPMNCPGHILIFKSRKRSYKELPIRYFELGTVYRFERSGVLHGLLRVRGFTQDDAHIFCTPEQLEDEIIRLIDLTVNIMKKFDITEFEAKLSTRDPENKEKYMGSNEDWERAEKALAKALETKNIEYTVEEGEAAFYGPKIDIHMTDALGRKWQLATIQLDFNLPKRFNATYMDKDNTEKHVVLIHRTILGSLERFFGILIEHYGGDFPVWLAPVQAIVIPVNDRFATYAREVYNVLFDNDVRVAIDDRPQTLNKRIRDAELHKIPYILVVGAREQANGTVSVRRRKVGNLGELSIEEFIQKIKEESRI